MPPRAVLFLRADAEFGTIAYFHLVEGVRPDITIFSEAGLVLSNRLYDPLHDGEEQAVEALRDFVASTDRPVFYSNNIYSEFPSTIFGFYRAVAKSSGHGDPRFALDAELYEAYTRLVRAEDRGDPWTIFHRHDIAWQMGRVLGATAARNPKDADALLDAHPLLAKDNLHAQLGVAMGMLHHPDSLDGRELLARVEEILPQITAELRPKYLAQVIHLQAVVMIRARDYGTATDLLNRSIETWPVRDNPSVQQLLTLHQTLGNDAAYRALQDRF